MNTGHAIAPPPPQETIIFEDGPTKVVKKPYVGWGGQIRGMIMELRSGNFLVGSSRSWNGGTDVPFKGKPTSFVKQRLKSRIKSLSSRITGLKAIEAERDFLQAELTRLGMDK